MRLLLAAALISAADFSSRRHAVLSAAVLTLICFAISVKGSRADVPLISRDTFFGNPDKVGGQISPDGKR